jgi:hypothetical protein
MTPEERASTLCERAWQARLSPSPYDIADAIRDAVAGGGSIRARGEAQ